MQSSLYSSSYLLQLAQRRRRILQRGAGDRTAALRRDGWGGSVISDRDRDAADWKVVSDWRPMLNSSPFYDAGLSCLSDLCYLVFEPSNSNRRECRYFILCGSIKPFQMCGGVIFRDKVCPHQSVWTFFRGCYSHFSQFVFNHCSCIELQHIFSMCMFLMSYVWFVGAITMRHSRRARWVSLFPLDRVYGWKHGLIRK